MVDNTRNLGKKSLGKKNQMRFFCNTKLYLQVHVFRSWPSFLLLCVIAPLLIWTELLCAQARVLSSLPSSQFRTLIPTQTFLLLLLFFLLVLLLLLLRLRLSPPKILKILRGEFLSDPACLISFVASPSSFLSSPPPSPIRYLLFQDVGANTAEQGGGGSRRFGGRKADVCGGEGEGWVEKKTQEFSRFF